MKRLSFFYPLFLVVVLLTLSLLPTQKVLAATITVDSTDQEVPFANDGDCTLGEAIAAANTDAIVDGCSAGAGADTIVLTNTTYTLTQVADTLDGANGLPNILGVLTIEGNGATITRDAGASAFRIFHMTSGTNLTLDSLTMSGGSATGAAAIDDNGGAILNDGGTLTITNSTFTDNSADDAGGAIYVSPGAASTTITNSTFNGNISNNSAASGGGAIANTSGAAMTITNVTIAGNIGNNPGVGGINSSGSTTLINTIVSQNTGAGNCTGAITDGGNNLSFPSCGALPTGDPLLSTGLASNGGLTQTMLPATGSPAIDGVAAGCPPPATDQRGFARPLGTNCDIGSVEVGTPLIASATCNGDNLDVTITAGDGPFDITGAGPDLPANSVNVGITSLTGPSTWTAVTVTETGGDGESINLVDFTCPATTALAASAVCFGDDLEVTITAGDGPFDITGTGPDLPANGVNVGFILLTGPSTWTAVTVTETSGDLEPLLLGDFTCPPPITLLASAACNGANLEVTITAGDGPFDITGTGPDLPANGVNFGTIPLTGPSTWTAVTVTETSGDLQPLLLGDFNCAAIPLDVIATCNGVNLDVTITDGDGPFDITGTGPGLPAIGVNASTTQLTGPSTWTAVTVTETSGNNESMLLGDFTCPPTTPLLATAACNGANLEVNITQGDGPFNITGTGNGLPANGVVVGTTILNGPGTWTTVEVVETGGNTQTAPLGDFTCTPTPLAASAACVGDDLVVTISAGDGPFDITGTGPDLPATGALVGATTLTGPGTWTNLQVEETGGDTQTLPLPDITCPPTPLAASAACVGDDLVVTISAGDGPFDITGTGPGLPVTGALVGATTLTGPGSWTNLQVEETGGDTQTLPLPDFTCPPTPLAASAACVGDDLVVTISAGDGPFDITGTGPDLPVTGALVGATTLTGPGTWTNLQVEETGGDLQTLPLPDFTCPPTPLAASAACVGDDLVVTISAGDGPFDITGTGPDLPVTGALVGATTLTGPGSWTNLQVEETGGDTQTAPLGDFTCPPPVLLAASAACVGDDLVVTITAGDGPFDITGTGPDLPVTGALVGATTLTGPGTWTNLQMEETGGDLQTLPLPDFTCPPPVLLAANAACVGNNLVVNITAGDGPFDITGTGPDLPVTGALVGATTLTGPGTWTAVTVTETSGDTTFTNLGDFTCPSLSTLAASAACVGDDLVVTITAGDGPFDITGTGPDLPATGALVGATTLTGPGAWTNLQVEETGGDLQTLPLPDFTCPPPVLLAASAACVGDDLVVNITAGDGPFDITGTGPDLPVTGALVGATTLTGPGAWTNLQVEETGGDLQTLPLPDITCPPPVLLAASAACVGDDLVVTISAGDGPFDITGTGNGLPANGVVAITTTLTGPGAWTAVTVTETGGDTQTAPLGDFTCPPPITLAASAACVGNDLVVTITAGDGPFDITGTGNGLPANGVVAVTTTLTGPGAWTAVTVTETGGDTQTAPLSDFTCPPTVLLIASAVCNGANLDVTITAGDGPFNITGAGNGLPANGVVAVTTTLTGPGAWTAVTVTETGGDTQTAPLGDFTCAAANVNLVASAACSGSNLRVTITAGDGPFDITGTGNGLPANGVTVGIRTLIGPGSWTGVTVTETTGDLQSSTLGNFTCAATTTPLAATASCTGNNLQVSITAGDGPFNITGAGNGLPNNGVGIGTTFYGGPGTWTGVSVRETTGDLQILNLGSFTCPTAGTTPTVIPTAGPTPTPIPPPPPPLCADIDGTTSAIIRAEVPAGTVTGGDVYCRVITQNGQFIQPPAEIGIRAVIDLGVIHAVDVFGLRPNNESAPDFNNPVQVCLQGSGSLVYLNALHAPRFAVVLTGTTSAEGYTCGNIPDAGTVVLTTNDGGLPTAPSASGQGGGGPFSLLGGCVIITQRRVNLRSGPALDMPILTIVPEGITLAATGRSGRWLLTNYAGLQGWVRAAYTSQYGTCG